MAEEGQHCDDCPLAAALLDDQPRRAAAGEIGQARDGTGTERARCLAAVDKILPSLAGLEPAETALELVRHVIESGLEVCP